MVQRHQQPYWHSSTAYICNDNFTITRWSSWPHEFAKVSVIVTLFDPCLFSDPVLPLYRPQCIAFSTVLSSRIPSQGICKIIFEKYCTEHIQSGFRPRDGTVVQAPAWVGCVQGNQDKVITFSQQYNANMCRKNSIRQSKVSL